MPRDMKNIKQKHSSTFNNTLNNNNHQAFCLYNVNTVHRME